MLIKCRDCGQPVSNAAKSCPKCGCGVKLSIDALRPPPDNSVSPANAALLCWLFGTALIAVPIGLVSPSDSDDQLIVNGMVSAMTSALAVAFGLGILRLPFSLRAQVAIAFVFSMAFWTCANAIAIHLNGFHVSAGALVLGAVIDSAVTVLPVVFIAKARTTSAGRAGTASTSTPARSSTPSDPGP